MIENAQQKETETQQETETLKYKQTIVDVVSKLKLVSKKNKIEKERNLLEEHLSKYQKFQKNDVIYILTNENDAKQNIFKVGKTSKKNLKSRLTTYNTGASNPYFYVSVFEVYNVKQVEKTIGYYLSPFRIFIESKKKFNNELFRVGFDYLQNIIQIVVDNDKRVAEFMNEKHKDIFHDSIYNTANKNINKIEP